MHSVAIIATLAAVAGSAVGQFSTVLTGSSAYITVPVDVDVEITLGNTAATATTTSDSSDSSGDGGTAVTETTMTTMTVTCAPAEGNCCPTYAYEWCVPVYQIPTTLLTLSSSGPSWGNSSDWVMCKDVCWNNCDVKDHDYSSHGTCEETASPCYYNHTSEIACKPTWTPCETTWTSCEPTWTSCEPTCWTKSSHAATTAVDGAVTGVPAAGTPVAGIPVAGTPVAGTPVAGAPGHAAPATHGPAPATIVGTASAPQSFGLKESLLALGGITALMLVFA